MPTLQFCHSNITTRMAYTTAVLGCNAIPELLLHAATNSPHDLEVRHNQQCKYFVIQ